MIISTNVEEVETIGEGKVIEAGISADSLSFVFELFSKGIYANPHNSIIRELVSNAYDANKDANIDDVTVIDLKIIGSMYVLFIEDKGSGISPDGMIKYMQWFDSSKRLTQNAIGGFGIGGKSPLSLFDYYNLTTVHKGIEYSYLISKGTKKPECTLLSSLPTTKRNGTVVSFEFENPYYGDAHLVKFRKAINEELKYFSGIYVASPLLDYLNDYEILEYETFKFNSKYHTNTIDILHCCLGQVTYPIDFSKINRQSITLPFALKFDIGDLDVFPNRETLIYSEKTIQKLQKKYDAFLRELNYLLEVSEHNECKDLYQYIIRKENKTSVIYLEGNKHKYAIQLWKSFGKKDYTYYTPLMNMIPNNFTYLLVDKVIRIKNSKRLKKEGSFKNSEASSYYLATSEKAINTNTNKHIVNGDVVIFRAKKKGNAQKYVNEIYQLRNRLIGKREAADIVERELRIKAASQTENINDLFDEQNGKISHYKRMSLSRKSEVGWSKRLYDTLQHQRMFLYLKCKKYDTDLPILKTPRVKKEKVAVENKTLGCTLLIPSSSSPYVDSRANVTIESLKDKIIFYCTKGDNDIHFKNLAVYSTFLYELYKESIKTSKLSSSKPLDDLMELTHKQVGKFVFLRINEGSKKDFMESSLMKVHISNFYRVKKLSKLFTKMHMSMKVRNEMQKTLKFVYTPKIRRISDYYCDLYIKANNFTDFSKEIGRSTPVDFYDAFKIKKNNVNLYTEYLTYIKEVRAFLDMTSDMDYISDQAPTSLLKKVISGKHLNWNKTVKQTIKQTNT